MGVWAQIKDEVITTIPPDGETVVDIYAEFNFGNDPVPDGTVIKFIAGKGVLSLSGEETEASVSSTVSPIQGVELLSSEGRVETRIVTRSDGTSVALKVAKATLRPIKDILTDNITVAAYSTYDRIGTASRFAFGFTTLTVSGGQGVFLTATDRYDITHNIWETKAPIPTGRAGVFCATVSNKIYAIGGFNGNFVTNCEEYEPVTDTWTIKQPMTVSRGFGCTAVVAGKIYVIGGSTYFPGRTTNIVEVYDPVVDTWTTLSPIPIPIAFAVCQVVGTDIWVFYGANKFTEKEEFSQKNSVVFKYDTATDTWAVSDAIWASPTPATTTLGADATAGDTRILIQRNAAFPDYGAVTIDRGGIQETIAYTSFQNDKAATTSNLVLATPLQFGHLSGVTVYDVALPRTRLAANIYYNASVFSMFNGFNPETAVINGTVETFDTSVTPPVSFVTATSSEIARQKAGQSLVGNDLFIVQGSAEKSDFIAQTEKVDVTTGIFVPSTAFAKPLIFRTSFGCSPAVIGVSNYIFAIGGYGSGHLPGWLKMEVKTSPEEVKADGKQVASVSVIATDASGDPPPDGTVFRVRGLLYLSKIQKAVTVTAATESRVPVQTISFLPVLFTSQTMYLLSGTASTVLLPRSEDMVNEVENLLSYAKGKEKVLSTEELKQTPVTFSSSAQGIGEIRTLYSVAVEVSVEDAFYYGQTDSDAAASTIPDTPLAQNSFSISPPVAKQGKSGSVAYTSDITSVPDIVVVSETTDLTTALDNLDTMQLEIPFGASPHYDAIVTGAQHRIPPQGYTYPATNIMVTASDNEESGSSYSPSEVVEEVNLVNGAEKFPVFVTTVVVTDPISLAARKARTDISDLEMISSETGGHSFSLDRPDYVSFIIDRIKTSAPSSMGSGTITMTHEMDGPIFALEFTVDNMIVGNSAQLTAEYSIDGYNFIDTGILLVAASSNYGYGIPVTTSYSFGVPLNAKTFRYTVALSSKYFNSPILDSVVIKYIKPNVQYLFTYPQNVNGQVSEMAAVNNERLPSGGTVTTGFIHGDSKNFDNEFITTAQPAISERGTITSIQRTGPLINGVIFRDELTTDDGLVFVSKSGPWAQDSITRVFVKNQEVLPSKFIPVPEEGKIVFRQRLPVTEVPTIEVQNKSSFVFGLRAYNPTLQTGVLDSFAYMFGETEAVKGLKANRPPVATNLFITPEPVFPGGPIVANYTFTDPDGDTEDTDQTQIIWYRNGVPVTALNNKKSISNSDILASRADSSADNVISRGQQWFFSIRPSDGRSFGPLTISHSITVANIPPTASNAILISSNSDPLVFTSADSITAQFKFDDNDQGDSDTGTIYAFFVNGIQVKSGTDNKIDTTEEDDEGNKLLGAGKTVYAIITPYDGHDFGSQVTTAIVTILTSPPTVTDVSILPTEPSILSSLNLSYKFVSLDGEKDQSTIQWYMNNTHMPTFDNLNIIASGNLKVVEQWYAVVTPNGGSSSGEPVKSNTIIVQS